MAGNRDPQRRPVLYDLKNQRLLADPAIGNKLIPVVPVGSFLTPSDIGVTVQAYDAASLSASDIGVTVQPYDAETAKLDTAQVFSAAQTFDSEVRMNGGNPGASGEALISQGAGSSPAWVDQRPRLYFYASF